MARVQVESDDRNLLMVLDHEGGTAWCPICQASMGKPGRVLEDAVAHVEWHEARGDTE